MDLFFREHITKEIQGPLEGRQISDVLFLNRDEAKCARFFKVLETLYLECSYYVGTDWIPHLENKWFYVEPKLNTRFDPVNGTEDEPVDEAKDLVKVDVLRMLFEALREPEVRKHTQELFEIKFGSEWIPLSRKEDLISPLIIIQFLDLVKDIVRKGLKKSYYKVEENLNAKVKGKVLVGQTIKKNLVRNKLINTFCLYEQFGVNGLENRILKKTLIFIRRYMNTFDGLESAPFFRETFNYIQPAFEGVSEEVSMNDVKHIKFNSFYKNYEKAIELAKLILKRFSYNLNSIQDKEIMLTPPYWIDMSKLFELYVLEKLIKTFPSEITYHFKASGNELDYLLVKDGDSLVIDSKYKPNYKAKTHKGYHKDIRQVSGYARLKKVRKEVGLLGTETQLGCLIIYPDQTASDSLPENLKLTEIKGYEGVWKLGVRLPDLDKRDKQK